MGAVFLPMLPAIFALGILSSASDIKHNRISNKLILSSLLYASVVYSTQVFFNTPFPLGLIALNITLSIALSFALFFKNIWSAGDGKLFVAYALLLPPTIFIKPLIPFFPSFDLLINVFIIGSFCVILANLPALIKRFSKQHSKMPFLKKKVLGFLIFSITLLSFSWIPRLALSQLLHFENIIVSLFIAYLLTFFLFRIIKKSPVKWIIMGALLLIGLFLNAIPLTISYFIWLILFSLIVYFLHYIIPSSLTFNKNVRIDNIKPRMILGNPFTSSITKIETGTILQDKHIALIKNSLKTSDYIIVKESLAFAPFIFLAVIVTLIIKSHIFFFFSV